MFSGTVRTNLDPFEEVSVCEHGLYDFIGLSSPALACVQCYFLPCVRPPESWRLHIWRDSDTAQCTPPTLYRCCLHARLHMGV